MKLKLVLGGLVISMLTFSWAVEPKSPTSFPGVKSTDPMMLIWPSVKSSKQGPGAVTGPSSKQKRVVKRVKALSKPAFAPSIRVKAFKGVRLANLLADLAEVQVIPPVIIGNPNESAWYNRVTMSVPIQYNLKVLESLSELYGFMITENKHGMIVLSATSEKVSVKFQFVTAYNALRSILKKSPVNYVISPSIVKLKKSLSLNLKDYSTHNALHVVAEAFDLRIKKGKGGALIIEPKVLKVRKKIKKMKKKKGKKKLQKNKKSTKNILIIDSKEIEKDKC